MNITFEDVARKNAESPWSPYGYVVTKNGDIYSLNEQHTHGVLLAILFPTVAKEQGYAPPDRDYDVYHYQQFELDNHDDFPVIRISTGSFSGFTLSFPNRGGISQEQRSSLSKIIKAEDKGINDRVDTEWGAMTLRSFLKKCEEQ